MSSYRTVAGQAMAEIVEKRSRFLGYVTPVETEQQALDFIAWVRARHRDARHHVYAYLLRDNHLQRYSDDGEPSGTAGMPTLDVLRKEELVDVCVVTVRYFGGTLLGTGGLVRAYTEAAKQGVCQAGIVTRQLCAQYQIEVEYPLLDRIQKEASLLGCILSDIQYTDRVQLTYHVPVTQKQFEKRLTDAASGQVTINKQVEGIYINVV